MEPARPPPPTPEKALLTLRIIWAALLMGQLVFLVIVLAIGPGMSGPDPDIMRMLFYVLVAILVTIIPVAHLIRGVIYNKGRQDGTVSPAAYATGSILFLAMCEGVGMAGLVFALLNGGRGPHLIVALIAIAVQAINFPTGGPMRGDDVIRPMHKR